MEPEVGVSFIREVRDEEAIGRVRELFDADLAKDGYVWNLTRVLALRPDVQMAWRGLVAAIRSHMDERRYELITLSAARALRASYCMLAHGRILSEKFFDADRVLAMARDPQTSGLSQGDIAMMEFAGKVACEANRVTQADVDRLRAVGFADEEILDIAFVAAARAFFSKVLDGVGVLPDAAYRNLDSRLRDALVTGRPIATGGTS